MNDNLIIAIASNNSHKLLEFQKIADLFDVTVQFIAPIELTSEKIEPEETGRDLFQNALIKAQAFYKALEIPVLSDDSGLFVDALDGRPGIYSARFAGEGADDTENNAKLLAELAGKTERSASFRAVLCYYDGRQHQYFEGECRGRITDGITGKKGFGYDPLFVPDGFEKTFAELGENIKNSLSHRKKALSAFFTWFGQDRRS